MKSGPPSRAPLELMRKKINYLEYSYLSQQSSCSSLPFHDHQLDNLVGNTARQSSPKGCHIHRLVPTRRSSWCMCQGIRNPFHARELCLLIAVDHSRRIRGGQGGQDPPPPSFFLGGGPPNFIKREKNVACMRAKMPRFST